MSERERLVKIDLVKADKRVSGILVDRDLTLAILADGQGLAVRLPPEDALDLAAQLSDRALEVFAREDAAAAAADCALSRILEEHRND